MSATDTLYQARFQTIEQIERGKDQTLRVEVYDAGALVAPNDGAVTVTDASGNVVVPAAAVTIAANVATYELVAADTTDLPLGEGWRIEWALEMPDGTVRMLRQNAALVRSRLLPAASWVDIFRREPGLDPSADHPIHSLAIEELDPYLDEAWTQIEARLRANGRRPWLIMSPESLREVLILGTLALIYQSFVTRLKPAYAEIAAMYRQMLTDAWATVRFDYDADNDGRTDGGSFPEQIGGQTSVWLGSFGDSTSPFTPWRF